MNVKRIYILFNNRFVKIKNNLVKHIENVWKEEKGNRSVEWFLIAFWIKDFFLYK